MSQDIRATDRATYGLFDYMGDVGGLIDLLRIILFWLLAPFSSQRLRGIITNRLFHSTNNTKK